MSRGTIVAGLAVLELAILGEMVAAVRGDQLVFWPVQHAIAAPQFISPPATNPGPGGQDLVEDGPHQIFPVGANPSLSVNIGNADMTILTGNPAQIEVSVSKSEAFGMFRATAPIKARKDGETVSITTTDGPSWSIGDDRMVTVVLPPQTRVTVIRGGDLTVTGLRAAASFTTHNGDVTIEDYDAPSLAVTTSDGHIKLRRVIATRIDATSGDGRVEATALQVRDGDIESGDGRVTLGFATGTDTVVSADTSDGKIRVTGFDATPAVAVKHKKSSDDDDSDNDGSSQTVRIGAGSGRLDVHSNDGNIELRQDG